MIIVLLVLKIIFIKQKIRLDWIKTFYKCTWLNKIKQKFKMANKIQNQYPKVFALVDFKFGVRFWNSKVATTRYKIIIIYYQIDLKISIWQFLGSLVLSPMLNFKNTIWRIQNGDQIWLNLIDIYGT